MSMASRSKARLEAARSLFWFGIVCLAALIVFHENLSALITFSLLVIAANLGVCFIAYRR